MTSDLPRRQFIKSLSIHLVAASLLPALKLVAKESYGPWISLFNSEDLTGWEGVNGTSHNWEVKDGTLVNTGRKSGNASWIAHEREFSDFELEVEFKFEPGCNSGVFFRTPLVKKSPAYLGNEIQIADMHDAQLKEKLSHDRHMGALYTVSPPSKEAAKKPGKWQRMTVFCKAEHCQVSVNGISVQDVQLSQCPKDILIEHPGLLRSTGHIGLQSKETPIEFRTVRIREIR
ncbi:DUF1080 domain-containing protein [Opitutia bacterium ISCC 51]|nr:DUF1080 domain-containing protein [Opitutae bacterium ISCC 51]QXD29586.1 DUF1080 domain-containing protein [Opitutae bacterium ISCC 52]